MFTLQYWLANAQNSISFTTGVYINSRIRNAQRVEK